MLLLKKGDKGPDVARLQHLLNIMLRPSLSLREDGDFGQKTHDAVLYFQQRKSLKPDGVVGPQTWTALGQRISTPPKPAVVHSETTANWMEIAIAEFGVHEESLPGAHNQRIVEYHSTTTLKATTDETPWCSSFVNWVMQQAGYSGTKNALAKSWLSWGGELSTPRYGAVTIIKKKGASSDQATGSASGFHVAFYVSNSATHIRLLGGNQGDQVRYSNYPFAGYEIKGHRWPG